MPMYQSYLKLPQEIPEPLTELVAGTWSRECWLVGTRNMGGSCQPKIHPCKGPQVFSPIRLFTQTLETALVGNVENGCQNILQGRKFVIYELSPHTQALTSHPSPHRYSKRWHHSHPGIFSYSYCWWTLVKEQKGQRGLMRKWKDPYDWVDVTWLIKENTIHQIPSESLSFSMQFGPECLKLWAEVRSTVLYAPLKDGKVTLCLPLNFTDSP